MWSVDAVTHLNDRSHGRRVIAAALDDTVTMKGQRGKIDGRPAEPMDG